jgi:hypothetical protein
MAYYLNLFSPQTWQTCKQGGYTLSGFSPRQRKTAQKIKPGDILLCYLVGLSRWCGALKVKSEAFDDDTPVFSDPDPFTVRFDVEPIHVFEPENSIPVFLDTVWNNLSLTRDIPKGATGWAVGFRGSLRSLPEEDGKLVMQLFAEQASAAATFPFDDRDRRQLARRTNIQSHLGTVVVEVPDAADDAEYEANDQEALNPEPDDIRQSLKVQAVLAQLGGLLGCKIWIAPGDRKKVAAQDHVDADLLLDRLPFDYGGTTMSTIEQIDVLWVRGRSIVRAFEVEHTTAIYSGLLRMADLLALQPNLAIKLHIVAPDDKREKVLRELRRPVFSLLESGPLYNSCTFLSYKALDEVTRLKHLSLMNAGILDEYDERANELA